MPCARVGVCAVVQHTLLDMRNIGTGLFNDVRSFRRAKFFPMQFPVFSQKRIECAVC